MIKRAFIIHVWGESPSSCWYSWLKTQLETQGIEVQVPAMPNTNAPDIEVWVGTLGRLLSQPDSRTFLIGHSVGCQTTLRYLAQLEDGKRIGGAFFVAPWTHLIGLSEASQAIAEPWLETSIDWQTAKQHCPRFEALFSDDDQYVPVSEEGIFREKLGAKTQILHGAGHFDNQKELSELLSLFAKDET